jgi:hypothetical protein
MSTDLSPTGSAMLKRAEELDALDAVLPFDRRDQLAELLTDDDVATLSIWPARAWVTIPCGRWHPISPISKPGVLSPPALPSPGRHTDSKYNFNCDRLEWI